MKKIRFFLPVFAFGALLFGMAGCDTGNDDFVNETPTTWKSLGNEVDSSVDAWWTFAENVDNITEDKSTPLVYQGLKLTADVGSKGATLAVAADSNVKFYYIPGAPNADSNKPVGKNTGSIKLSKSGSSSLTNFSKGACFVLTVDGATNITVRVKGGGPDALETRFLLITDENGEPIVYKDYLSSGEEYTVLHIKGASAGTYKIYSAGIQISEIAASSVGNDIDEAKGYESNKDLDVIKETFKPLSGGTAYEALVESCILTASEKSGSDITASAVWEILEGDDIATVKAGVVSAKSKDSEGTVKIRARVGRFYTETYEVTFKKCTHQFVTTFDGSNLPESGTVIYWDYATRYADGEKATDDQKKANKKLRDAEVAKINKISRLVYSGKDVGITVENTNDTTDAEASKAMVDVKSIVQNYPWTDEEKKDKPYDKVMNRGNDYNVSKGSATGFQWKDESSDNVTVGTEYVSFTFTVTPESGKTPKLAGIYGAVMCGKGKDRMVGDVFIDKEKVNADSSYEVVKSTAVPYSLMFAPVEINTKTDITLVFAVAKADKEISLQVRDVGLIFE